AGSIPAARSIFPESPRGKASLSWPYATADQAEEAFACGVFAAEMQPAHDKALEFAQQAA
ncbi:MAG: hypothetical protein AB1563_13145, partial [Bacillota bacterium]